jgi:hypothetical protein
MQAELHRRLSKRGAIWKVKQCQGMPTIPRCQTVPIIGPCDPRPMTFTSRASLKNEPSALFQPPASGARPQCPACQRFRAAISHALSAPSLLYHLLPTSCLPRSLAQAPTPILSM